MAQANLTSLDATMKYKYGPSIEDLVNKKTLLLDRINQRKKKFPGKLWVQPKMLATGGGIGARSGASPTLPTAGRTVQEELQATAKKLYARLDIDREAIIAGRKSEQVFIDSTKHEIKAKADRFALDLNRQFYGNGGGSLGLVSSAVTGASGTIVVTAATWNQNYFMEGDRIQLYADNSGVPGALIGSSTVSTISSIAPSTRTLTFDSVDASAAAGQHIVLEGNANNELTGFASHIDDQSSTIHNINKTTYFRARGVYQDASSASVSVDLMNQLVQQMVSVSVEQPKMVITSPKQWRLISQLLENAKIYYAKDSDKGKFGFGALEYISPLGVLPVYADRFCPDEKMYFVNPESFQFIQREDFGWFDEDGTILMRQATTDAYEARYGGYSELICTCENSNGVLDNLA